MIDVESLIEQKHELIRKLDHEYKSVQEKELDLAELSKLKKQIKEITYAKIKGQRVKLVKKLDKTTSIKDVRKIYNEKYESLRLQTIAALNFYKALVEEKKSARSLKDDFDAIARKQKSGKKLSSKDRMVIEEILGW